MRLYGKNSVSERIKAQPKTIKKIYCNNNADNADIRKLAIEENIPVLQLADGEFKKIAQHVHAQGVMAEIQDFTYADLEEILRLPNEKKVTLIALSNITDPQNLGSILRTAACFGNFALIIPRHRSASVNETVLKVACGGENYIPVIQETNLVTALERAKIAGYWISGTVVGAGENITGFKFTFPLCLVIGSEDKGIRRGVLANLDFKLTLPMPGKELSLNAAVATAIFCYEITRQRQANL